MYLSITTRCNMQCSHCCMSATSEGKDMSLEVFKAAIQLDECATLGGGEPTLHPQFEKFLFLAMANCEYVWLATNGSNTEIALSLAKLAKKGIIGCDLSQDDFHDPIDQEVIDAFTIGKNVTTCYGCETHDLRGIRNVNNHVLNVGRAKEGGIGWEEGCGCEDIFIDTDGNAHRCGCLGSPIIGDVFNGIENLELGNCCYRIKGTVNG